MIACAVMAALFFNIFPANYKMTDEPAYREPAAIITPRALSGRAGITIIK